ncbi:ribose ABC transporter [Acetobacteraceae bacterium KSS8]|uniref:Ribose ABC transporter n=1 Tax=Endosaccharibacter trunci TaxID=2812733 RepID=A0ABT1WA45_9PROT|nr:ribose ABC transporter [Acetobacteraceae bacterium KSS8]
MLIGIDPLLSPDLLHSLAAMGHGDELVIVDRNFPAAAIAARVHRLPGITAARALEAVLSVFPLDSFVPNPAATMQVVGAPDAVPPAVADLTAVLERHGARAAETVERFAFYERARKAFAIVQTGEDRPYGNIILGKGIIIAQT